MDSGESPEFPSIAEKALEFIPPPPPSFPKYSNHQSRSIRGSSRSYDSSMDRLFDEGYRADVSILTEGGGVLYAHAPILGTASPVFKAMLKKLHGGGGRKKPRSIPIVGVPAEAVRIFIRLLYSSSYEEEKMKENVLPLLVLSHAYAVPELKRFAEYWIEKRYITTENVIDIFQLALLCDAPRLGLVCHRFAMSNFKAVSNSEGWRDMKQSHPVLEKEILDSIKLEEARNKERTRKREERKVYMQLYDAMEALVHICNEGCRTIRPYDKIPRHNQSPCEYGACKGLETLIRHFARCNMRGVRGPGGCLRCKRMWQILEFHSMLCANPDSCKVPLCRSYRQGREKRSKKDEMLWRVLVKKTVRSKSITGAPFFSLGV